MESSKLVKSLVDLIAKHGDKTITFAIVDSAEEYVSNPYYDEEEEHFVIIGIDE